MKASKVEFYVPSTQGLDGKIDDQTFADRVRDISRQFSALFGGATAKGDNVGYFLSETGQLVEEKVTIVSSFCLDNLADHYDRLFEIAREAKADWKQESILLDINGEVNFI